MYTYPFLFILAFTLIILLPSPLPFPFALPFPLPPSYPLPLPSPSPFLPLSRSHQGYTDGQPSALTLAFTLTFTLNLKFIITLTLTYTLTLALALTLTLILLPLPYPFPCPFPPCPYPCPYPYPCSCPWPCPWSYCSSPILAITLSFLLVLPFLSLLPFCSYPFLYPYPYPELVSGDIVAFLFLQAASTGNSRDESLSALVKEVRELVEELMEQVGVNEAKSLADLKDFTQKFKARAPLPRSTHRYRYDKRGVSSRVVLSCCSLFVVPVTPNCTRTACSLALLPSLRHCILCQSGLMNSGEQIIFRWSKEYCRNFIRGDFILGIFPWVVGCNSNYLVSECSTMTTCTQQPLASIRQKSEYRLPLCP